MIRLLLQNISLKNLHPGRPFGGYFVSTGDNRVLFLAKCIV